MQEISHETIETIYQRIKNTTVEIHSIVPDASDVSPSKEDCFLFNAISELISKSELIVVPPFAFDDNDGIYQFRDIYFSRLVFPGDEGPPDYKPNNIQSLEKLTEDEVFAKKRDWLIESEILAEMLSDNPSEEKINKLQQQLGDGYESPYTLVPPPNGDEN